MRARVNVLEFQCPICGAMQYKLIDSSLQSDVVSSLITCKNYKCKYSSLADDYPYEIYDTVDVEIDIGDLFTTLRSLDE